MCAGAAPSRTGKTRSGLIGPDAAEEMALAGLGYGRIAGVDEVGRGAWVGPLVAAAVILPDLTSSGVPADLAGVRDSKLLTSRAREELDEQIRRCARAVGVGAIGPEEIDLLGIGRAGEVAMLRAVRALAVQPDYLLVDAFRLRGCPIPQKGIIGGDTRCVSIAAASIVAKVVRDRWLRQLDARYPGYGLDRHKGYGAPEHRSALRPLAPPPIHRLPYPPVIAAGQDPG